MSYILAINTAQEHASVVLCNNNLVVGAIENKEPQNHAAFVHTAIQELIHQAQIGLSQIQALAVIAGPGSYTGIRVGLSTAKGLAYALKKPLITINTLDVMAKAALKHSSYNNNMFICPMIDARRSEVFYALYNQQLQYLHQPTHAIVDVHFLENELKDNPVCFLGSGAAKFKALADSSNVLFIDATVESKDICAIAYELWLSNSFADVAYSEPFYLKDVFIASKVNK